MPRQRQNDLEVKEARVQIENVNKEAGVIQQLKEQLESEIEEIRERILELNQENRDLERRKIALQEEREDLKKYEGEFQKEKLLEARGDDANRWYNKKLKRKVFQLLNQAVELSRVTNSFLFLF